jgi:hypothetical protein
LLGGGQTFHNVSFTSGATGNRTISGANTFNNLTLTASAAGMSQLAIAADQTVNGTFTCAGSSATQRGFVRSNTPGTTRTITAAAVSAADCDFRDITIAGAAAPISPTRAGNCGGNSGITFPAAKTVFWNLTGTQNWNATGWATSSNGTPAVNNFPLAQDTATFTNDGAAGTVAFGVSYNAGTLDLSGRTSAMTLNHNADFNIYGGYTLGSGVTVSGTGTQTFAGSGTQIFTSVGKTITFRLTVDKPSGAFELGDAYLSSGPATHTRGTFDAKNYNVTCASFASSNTNTRTLTMGSGLWTLSGIGTMWSTATTTGLTFNKDTADILLSDTSATSRTFNGGGLSFNKLTIGGATGTSTTSLTGANTFSELASTKTVAHTITITVTASGMTIGTWSITGTAGNVVTVNSSNAGNQRNVNLTNVTSGIDYLAVQDIAVNQANRFYVGANSTNNGNNSNVIFTAAPAGTQTLNPSLYTNDNIFYAQVVKGFNALAPPLYDNVNVFYAATVTQTAPTQTLLPSRYDNLNVFYAATVDRGVVTLLPSLYSNTNTFYAATVGRGAVTLLPSLYSNPNTFYAATVTATGPTQTLLPPLYSNTNTFFAAVARATNAIRPSLFVNTNAVYPPVVSLGEAILAPSLFVNGNRFFAATATATRQLAPTRLDNSNTFYVASAKSSNRVLPGLYVNPNVLYPPTLTYDQPLAPLRVSNINRFFLQELLLFPWNPSDTHPSYGRILTAPRSAITVTEAPRSPMPLTVYNPPAF